MTSSPRSKSDFGKRRALFVSAHKIAVYHWHKGDLASSYLFDANQEGKQFFERYLRETPNIPMYMLVDVFEEEFKRETVPHVFGADRESIIERKKARLFRDTPYYSATVQGRETEGRKDDQLLLSAITNPKLISTWVELLEKYMVPLAGIYSIPLLTESMLKLLPEAGDNNLVVSIQSISGLRQTFISNKQLRVSRLVQLPRYGTEPYAPHIREEVEKIRRYLNSVRLVPTDQNSSLNVFFLMNGELLEDLKQEYKEMTTSGIHFVDINDLLTRSGSARQVSSPFSDQLYIHQLLKQKPANKYARPVEQRYNKMRNMRLAMLGSSALMVLASMIWGGYTIMGGIGHRQNTLAAEAKTAFYTTRYQIAREGLPQTPVEPADLKAAVELYKSLASYKASPLEMVTLLSNSLNRFPYIVPGNLDWITSTDPNTKVGAKPAGAKQGVIGYTNVTGTTEKTYDYYQIAEMEGKVFPFDGNFRVAISMINEFAESLRSQEDVFDVSIMSLPLDVSSEASLQGNTNSTQIEALFSLRVVLGITKDEE
jgi:hypothetical protein